MPTISIPMSPVQVVEHYYWAINAGNADDALALFDADAVRLDTATPNKAIKGREQIGNGIRSRIVDHIFIEATDYQVNGEQVTCFAKVSTDYARRVGFAPVEEDVVVTVKDSLIIKFVVTVTPESLARMRAAEVNQ